MTQAKALQIADRLQRIMPQFITSADLDEIAGELRRLHAQREELLEALKTLPQSLSSTDEDLDRWMVKARAAIVKAEEA